MAPNRSKGRCYNFSNWTSRTCRSGDMFGQSIGFNIDGEEKYRTFTGACCSSLILFFCLFYGLVSMKDTIMNEGNSLERLPLAQLAEGKNRVHGPASSFKFAIGVSSPRDFERENWRYINKFVRYQLIAEDYRMGNKKEIKIEMKACQEKDFDFEEDGGFFPFRPDQESRIQAHIDASQFMCPFLNVKSRTE